MIVVWNQKVEKGLTKWMQEAEKMHVFLNVWMQKRAILRNLKDYIN